MLETVPGLRPIAIPFDNGMNEESASDSLSLSESVRMLNWRLSRDGTRMQKRLGVSVSSSGFGEDIYGYHTYYDGSANFCQLIILESKVQRKVGTGSWSTIYTFSANIDRPVEVLSLQDKQFVITTKGSFIVQGDGTITAIGIAKPTSIPTVVSSYPAVVTTPPLNDAMNYANTAALVAAWETVGTITLQTTDPDGVVGPDADHKYMKVYAANGTYAIARRTVATSGSGGGSGSVLTSSIPATWSSELDVYFDDLPKLSYSSGNPYGSGLNLYIDNGLFLIKLLIGSDGIAIIPKNEIMTTIMVGTIPNNKQIKFSFSINGEDTKNVIVDVFMTYDGIIQASGQATIYPATTTGAGEAWIKAYSPIFVTSHTVTAYIDHTRINSVDQDTETITGLYQYAVSFSHTGLGEANYPVESEPIKSSIGSVVFHGTGLNDMTVDTDSEYAGMSSKEIWVSVSTTGAQDIIKWSVDGGANWSAALGLSTKMYLGYGVWVNFGAVTGHTATDYWVIPCSAISAVSTMQQITLTSIPTSADSQVDTRILYRTASGGGTFYYLTSIYDNTTTTFVDNMDDAMLGEEMEEDRQRIVDICDGAPTYATWWDERLWVADAAENVAYYSAVRSGGAAPEEFDADDRFITIGRGDNGNPITGMMAYHDSLYIFKNNDIYVVQKASGGYGVYHLNSDVGSVNNSVIAVKDLLIFLSESGLELYDGVKPYGSQFSEKIRTTLATITKSGYQYITSAHDKEYNEVWFSLPDRTSGSAIVLCWNYAKNCFYAFQFYKTFSWMGRVKSASGGTVLMAGTRDGYLLTCDSGTTDAASLITASYRKGWLDLGRHGIAHLLRLRHEIPSGKTLTMNLYIDMDKDVARTQALAGVALASTDIDFRRIIDGKSELGLRCRWISLELINAEDVGGDLKVNAATIYLRSEKEKGAIYGD